MRKPFKNLTIRQLTWSMASLLFLVSTLLIIFVLIFVKGFNGISIKLFLLLLIGLFIGIFFSVKTLFEGFIFRKIKLIYKIISDVKLSKEARKNEVITSDMSLNDVDNEVAEWAESTQKEITDIKKLEEYRKLYVGNISHELKTPIFSIQGYIHTLLDGGMYDENINRKYLERAAVNITRLQMIVDDLELINKLESEINNVSKSIFDIRELCQEVMEDLESKAKEKDIKISFKAGTNISYMVNADIAWIQQVLANLISNAIKYGKEKGKVKISLYDLDQKILVEVSDNGIGIEEQHLKHVFDRFYRIDVSRSRVQGGSGLGLSIVKHIIEAHDETINVRSTKGVGSTFGFTLSKK